MRIAQVAPLAEAVPPKAYGGTERVVSWLTEELVRRGHEVTLFASGDSVTRARLEPVVPLALRLENKLSLFHAHTMLQMELVADYAHEFDIIHYHVDYHHFSLSRRSKIPNVTTMHGRLDLPDLALLFDCFREMPVVSISDAQRAPLPQANWVGTVYHGLPRTLLGFQPNPQGYFAFLGRTSPEKGLDRAIEIANALRQPLRIAAKVDQADRQYFKEVIEPMLNSPYVEFIGEIDDNQKSEFLGNAKALLFPINWPEPFGLTMIEAMACGTPVVAFKHGSVPEVLSHGITALLVDNMPDAIAAAERIEELDRRVCRETFERRFSVEAMADGYERLFERVANAPRATRIGQTKSFAA